MGCNNPALELCAEAQDIFHGQKIDCIISIGTGSSPGNEMRQPKWWQTKIPINVVPTLVNIANDCEKTHEIMYRDFREKSDVYFRFNVDGMGNIGLEEWELLGDIRGKTVAYINKPEVNKQVDAAVKALHLSLLSSNSRM
jgi:hypothetical protein